MTKINAVQNRTLLDGGVEKNPCQNEDCQEPYVFVFKNNNAEFSIGLMNILDCLRLAEKQGAVPPIDNKWWDIVDFRYLRL